MGITLSDGDEGLNYSVKFTLRKEQLMQWRRIPMLDSSAARTFKRY